MGIKEIKKVRERDEGVGGSYGEGGTRVQEEVRVMEEVNREN